MYPNAFLQTFWRNELRPQVFVAMSFDEVHKRRYEEVIAPAVQSVLVGSVRLTPYRVDLSKTGDSILTEILDGIAHSQMILADVSTVGHDSKTGAAYRNGNVMYEVGLALACRQSSEVLLLRDDKDKFLFDVSTIPHKPINFAAPETAIKEISDELVARINQRSYFNDARLKIAVASLTYQERAVIELFSKYRAGDVFWINKEAMSLLTASALDRLLDKQLIRAAGQTNKSEVAYSWTELGQHVVEVIKRELPFVEAPPKEAVVDSSKDEVPPQPPSLDGGTPQQPLAGNA